MSDNSESYGCGCLLFFVVPLLVFASAYLAHCGWSAYTP